MGPKSVNFHAWKNTIATAKKKTFSVSAEWLKFIKNFHNVCTPLTINVISLCRRGRSIPYERTEAGSFIISVINSGPHCYFIIFRYAAAKRKLTNCVEPFSYELINLTLTRNSSCVMVIQINLGV
jgi:hypothetical protein